MKKFIQSFFYFILFLILLSISILGSVTPERISATAGGFQIAPFRNGLSLYQNSRGKYYTLSPFDDYELSGDNVRASFISIEQVKNNSYRQDTHRNYIQKLAQSFSDYFGKDSENVTFTTDDKTISYQTTVEGNHIFIQRKTRFSDNASPKILVMTLSFQGNDFVYDAKDTLFSYIPEEQITSFNTIYGMSLYQNLDFLKVAVSDKKVFVVNPDLSGVIGVKGKSHQIVRINRDAKLVEIEEVVTPNNGMYTMSFDMYIFDSPKEAQLNL